MLRFQTQRGRKGRGDRLFLIRTDGWEPLSYEDLLRLLQRLFRNEDRSYPKSEGYRGRDMLLEAINRVAKGETVPGVLSDYRLACNTIFLHELM